MRDRGGRERRGVKGGERRGAGSHIARLRAVNNLEEHWGDETKMNTKHWQRLTQSCSYISEYHRAESSPSAALPPSPLPHPPSPFFFFFFLALHLPPSVSGRKQLYAILVLPHIL